MKHAREFSLVEGRRQFLRLVSASLPLLGASACNDEPIVVVGPPEPPPAGALDYLELVRGYFGEEALEHASLIGEYRVRATDWDVTAAFASTAQLQELADTASSVADAVVQLGVRLQQDFEALRIVDVVGWTLGRTEVELCVLAWLNVPSGS